MSWWGWACQKMHSPFAIASIAFEQEGIGPAEVIEMLGQWGCERNSSYIIIQPVLMTTTMANLMHRNLLISSAL